MKKKKVLKIGAILGLTFLATVPVFPVQAYGGGADEEYSVSAVEDPDETTGTGVTGDGSTGSGSTGAGSSGTGSRSTTSGSNGSGSSTGDSSGSSSGTGSTGGSGETIPTTPPSQHSKTRKIQL